MFFKTWRPSNAMNNQCQQIRTNFQNIFAREHEFKTFLGDDGWNELQPLLIHYQEILIESVLHSKNYEQHWDNAAITALWELSNFGYVNEHEPRSPPKPTLQINIQQRLTSFKNSNSIDTRPTFIDRYHVWREKHANELVFVFASPIVVSLCCVLLMATLPVIGIIFDGVVALLAIAIITANQDFWRSEETKVKEQISTVLDNDLRLKPDQYSITPRREYYSGGFKDLRPKIVAPLTCEERIRLENYRPLTQEEAITRLPPLNVP